MRRGVLIQPYPRSMSMIGIILVVLATAFSSSYCIADQGDEVESAPEPVETVVKIDGDVIRIEEPEFDGKSESELRDSLTNIQFKVTQKEDTEPAFRNSYWDNKKSGVYQCVVCGQTLFTSNTKYKSGTGWPSFWAPVKKERVAYKTDYHLFYSRTEVHCSRCKAHLGHVFDDGPKDTTGKRYCMNSASLKFISREDLKAKEEKRDEAE